jgi:protein-S-isoprenylcysteine O-methyltransferase Ste14
MLSKFAVGVALYALCYKVTLPTDVLSKEKGDKPALAGVLTARLLNLLESLKLILIPLLVAWNLQTDPDYPLLATWTTYDLVAVAISLAGYGLRLWSMHELGHLFTAELGIRKDHRLVQTGPYRRLRHPAYTGGFLGFAAFVWFLGIRAWFYWAPAMYLGTFLLGWRVRSEEKMLHKHFGKEWSQYAKRTWRLIPYVV